MSQTAPPQNPAREPWGRDLLLLSVLFGIVLAWKLGSAPLANPDEGRYAEVPREMLATNDWVTPRLNGVPYFEKPPLVYWAVALCEKVLGPSEWSLRLTPSLFALGGILSAYAAARKIYGREAGLWSAIVLGTSLLYVALSRLLLLDMAVSVLMSSTLFCFILAVREPPGTKRRWLYYGLYASAALATLTKGFIGFLLTGAVMFLWLLLFGQWKRLRPMHLPTGIVLFLAIAAPWHVLVNQRNPGWAHFYIIYEHWQRYTETGHARTGQFWIFLPIVLLGLFPWTGFLWCAFRDSLAGGWARRKENAEAWFFAAWAIFIFLFFSKSQSKLIPYILPVFPPIAVLIGKWLAENMHLADAYNRMKVPLRVFGFLCGLLAAALCVAVLSQRIIRDAHAREALAPYAYIIAAILCIGGLRAMIPRGGSGREGARGAVIAISATLIFMFGMLAIARETIQETTKPGTRDVALIARGLIGPGDKVYHYHNYFQDFPYYAGRVVGLVRYQDELELQFLDPVEKADRFIDDAEFMREWVGPSKIYAIARNRDTPELFSQPAFKDRLHIVYTGPGHCLFSNQP